MKVEEEILLSLTNKNLETGLRGVPVGYCSTSFVDSQKGLHYRGYNIKGLAYKSPGRKYLFTITWRVAYT